MQEREGGESPLCRSVRQNREVAAVQEREGGKSPLCRSVKAGREVCCY